MANFKYQSNLSSTVASANISNIIGGEASFVYSYFQSKFPDKFFNDTYISQELNSFKFGNPFPVQRLPLLAMGSEFELEESSLGPIQRQYTTMYTVRNDKERYYRKIFNDEENNVYMYSVDNRAILKHNFAIKLQTQAQAWNVVNYINQNFETAGKVFLNNIRLPAVLPNNFIFNICEHFGWDINNPDPSIAESARESLRAYLIEYGLGGITEQINPETGNISYMYDYTTNLMLSYPDNAAHEASITDLVVKNAIVRYQITSEFWFPASFIIDFDSQFKLVPKVDDTGLSNLKTKFSIVLQKDLIPHVTDKGFKYIRQARYTPDLNNKVDIINISTFFDKAIFNIIKIGKKYNFDIRKLVSFIMYKNNIPLSEDDYEVDLDKLEIKVNEPTRNDNYTLVLYGDLKKLNILNEYVVKKNTKEIMKMDIFPDHDFSKSKINLKKE